MRAIAGELAIAGAEREAAAAVDAGEVRIETRGLLDDRLTNLQQQLLGPMGPVRREMLRLLPLQRRDLRFARVLRKGEGGRDEQAHDDTDSHGRCIVQDVLRPPRFHFTRHHVRVSANLTDLTTYRELGAGQDRRARDSPPLAALPGRCGVGLSLASADGRASSNNDLAQPREGSSGLLDWDRRLKLTGESCAWQAA